MAKNRDNVRVWGDLESDVFLAPLGTTLPTTIDGDLAPAFKPLGWLSEDGFSENLSAETLKIKGWQGGSTVRTKVTSTEQSFTVQMLEDNPVTSSIYYGHDAPAKSGSTARLNLPETLPTIERAAVVKLTDGTRTRLICYERVQVTDRGQADYKATEATVREVTMEVLGQRYVLTNDPAFLE